MRKYLLVIGIIVSNSCMSQDISKLLEDYFRRYTGVGLFQGNVLIASGDTVIWQQSYGNADHATNRKLNDQSVFELASDSKQFTAMGRVLLKEQGKLKYEDSLRHFFPELPYSNISIRQLLQHTSGLPDYMNLVLEHTPAGSIATNKEMIAILARHKPAILFAPGAKWEYSNTGYVLLASIIEKASGISFSDFLQKNIFTPLGMKNTEVYRRRYEKRSIENYALGHVYDTATKKYILPDDHPELKEFITKLDGICGDGTVNSTTGDLLKWSRAIDQNLLISESVRTEVLTSGADNRNIKHGYGFGWMLRRMEPAGRVAFHTGGWPGYNTLIEKHLDHRKTIIILSNHDQFNIDMDELRNILYGIKTIARQEAKVEESILKQYIGKYELTPDFFISIFLENGRIYAQATGQSRAEIFSEKDDLFFLKVVKAQIRFVRNEKKEVTGLLLIQNGQEMPGKKVQ
ncbi:MAG: serine hydrolase [Chitinophagaceae bacterium]|nr:serine hydrolase [Chitinophagaceae bacterium]